MPTIDERIVQLIFDNSKFESNAAQSQSTLNKLDNTIEAFGGTGSSAFRGVEQSIASVSTGFSKLQIAGATMVASLTRDIYNLGTRFAKSLTIDQYTAGFGKYESSLKSVRTMMLQTGETIDSVERVMKQALKYSDETSYDYSQIGDLMSQFVGAGAKISDAEKMAEGVSNIGAYAGKASNEMAIVYRNFADVYAKGFLSANDYRSLNDIAHVLTPKFKEELINSAEAYGYLEKKADGYYYTTDKIAKMTGNKAGKLVNPTNLKDSLIYQWAQKDVIEDVLDKFTYTEGKSLDSLAYKAYQAAKEYRTFGDVVMTVKDVTSTAISTSFKSVFGNTDEAVELWTAVGDKMVEIFAGPFVAISDGLEEWKNSGGRFYLLETLKNLWNPIDKFFSTIKGSWDGVFDKSVSDIVFDFTYKLLQLGDKLKMSDEGLGNIERFFTGIFSFSKSIVSTLGKAGSAVFKPILDFFGLKTDGFLDGLGKVGDYLSALANTLTVSEIIDNIFTTISQSITAILTSIDSTIDKIKNSKFVNYLGDIFNGLKNVLSGSSDFGTFLANDVFGGNTLQNFIKGSELLPAILTGLVAIFASGEIKKLITVLTGGSFGSNAGKSSGVIKSIIGFIKSALEELDNIANARINLAASTSMLSAISSFILKIAATMFLTAAALTMLGYLSNTGTLYNAIGALTIIFGIYAAIISLVNSKIIKSGIGGKGAAAKAASFSAMSVSLGVTIALLAASTVVIAAALTLISLTNIDKLERGAAVLTVVIGVLALIVGLLGKYSSTLSTFSRTVGKNKTSTSGKKSSGSLLAAAISMTVIAFACDLIAVALMGVSIINPGRLALSAGILLATVAVLALILKGLGKNSTSLLGSSLKGTFSKWVSAAGSLLGLVALAAVLSVIAVSLAAVSLVPPGRLALSALILVGTVGVLALIVGALSKSSALSSETGARGIGIFAARILGIMALVAAIAVIAPILAAMSLLNPGKVAVAAGIMSAVIVVFSLIIGGLAKFADNNISWGKVGNVALSLLGVAALAGIMLAVATALAILSAIPVDKLTTAGKAFAIILGIFAGISWAISKMKFDPNKTKSIGSVLSSMAVMAVMAIAIAASVKAIGEAASGIQKLISSEKGWMSLAIVIGLVIGFVVALKILIDILTTSAATAPALLEMSGALLTFGLACLTIAGSIFLIVAAFGGLMALIYLLGKAFIKLGEGGEEMADKIERGIQTMDTVLFDGLYAILYGVIASLAAALTDASPMIAKAALVLINDLTIAVIGGLILAFENISKYLKLGWRYIAGEIDANELWSAFTDDFSNSGVLSGIYGAGVDAGKARAQGELDGYIDELSSNKDVIGSTKEEAFDQAAETLAAAGIAAAIGGPKAALVAGSIPGAARLNAQENYGYMDEAQLPLDGRQQMSKIINGLVSFFGATSSGFSEARISSSEMNTRTGKYASVAESESGAYVSGLDTMESGAKASAENTVAGAISVLMDRVESFFEAGAAAALAYESGYNSTMDIHSPSRKMKKSGLNTAKGLSVGLSTGGKQVIKETADLGDKIGETITGYVSKKVEESGGLEGLVDRFGEFTGSDMSAFKDAMKDAADAVSGGGSSGSKKPTVTNSQLNEYKKNGWTVVKNSDGTYTAWSPVGNLSSAESSQYSVDLGYLATPGKKGKKFDYGSYNDQGGSYSFVQNNYSPKSLSRIEIYRQTQNQFNNWKAGSSYRYD